MKNPLRRLGGQWIAKSVALALAVVVAGMAGIVVRNLPKPADQTLAGLASRSGVGWVGARLG